MDRLRRPALVRQDVARKRLTLALVMGNGHPKNALRRKGMTACAVVGKEVTVAGPRTFVESNGMCVILAAERSLELAELDTVWLHGILLGLRDFADHAGVHSLALAFLWASDVNAVVGSLSCPVCASGRFLRPALHREFDISLGTS